MTPRSSSIPIPRSASTSASRNIESLITIPFASPSRHPVSPTRQQRHSPSVPLVSSIPGRDPSRTPFEPTVIRASGPDHHATDTECLPQSSAPSSQIRRMSSANARGSGLQQPLVSHNAARTTPAPFLRPAYLEYSSLRHFLQTEVPSVSSARKIEPVSTPGPRTQAYFASMSTQSDDDDSIATPPPQSRLPTPRHDQTLQLPTRWSEPDRHQNLSVSLDGRDLTYQGPPSNGDKDASAARANHPIPPACGIYYFEVEIVSKEQKAHISIGFAGRSVKFTRLPGWEPNSWGYYGEDGYTLFADKTGSQYGPPFGNGDTVGCGIDFTTHKAFYTRNGTLIGPVFDNVGKNMDLYPSVGLQHPGDVIRTNFGQEPFKYDIDYHVQQQSNTTWTRILGTSLDHTLLRRYHRRSSIASLTNDTSAKSSLTEQESKDLLNQLVMSYLVHHGYARTARAFEKHPATTVSSTKFDVDVDISKSNVVESDIESRTNIVNSVLVGDIDTAIDGVQKNYPIVLEADDHLIFFKLRCRKFVELILETAEMKKRMKTIQTAPAQYYESTHQSWVDEEMDIDIDDDMCTSLAPESLSNNYAENLASQYESALNVAITYGQTLSNDYQSDPRPELQELFKQTFGIVAWEDPLAAGSPVAELAGQDARVALAHDLNQAILKSQGRPAQPALETIYRHTSVCITHLGLLGVGAAAFADMPREFLQPR